MLGLPKPQLPIIGTMSTKQPNKTKDDNGIIVDNGSKSPIASPCQPVDRASNELPGGKFSADGAGIDDSLPIVDSDQAIDKLLHDTEPCQPLPVAVIGDVVKDETGQAVAWCADDDVMVSDLQTTGPLDSGDGSTVLKHSDSADTIFPHTKNIDRFGKELGYSPEERWRKRFREIESVIESGEEIEEEVLKGYGSDLVKYSTQMVDIRLQERANRCIRMIVTGKAKGDIINQLMKFILLEKGYTIDEWIDNQLVIARQKRDWKARQKAQNTLVTILGAHGFTDKAKEVASSVTNNHTMININITQADAQEGAERGAKYGGLLK